MKEERKRGLWLNDSGTLQTCSVGAGCKHEVHHLLAEPCGISYGEMRKTLKEALRKEQ